MTKFPKGRAWQFLTKEKRKSALYELLSPVVATLAPDSNQELLLEALVATLAEAL